MFQLPSRTRIEERIDTENRITAYLTTGRFTNDDIEWLITAAYKIFNRPPRDIPDGTIENDSGTFQQIDINPATAGGRSLRSRGTRNQQEILMPEPPVRTQWTHFLKSVLCIRADDLFWVTLLVERQVAALPIPEFLRGIKHEEDPSRLSVMMRYMTLLRNTAEALSPLPTGVTVQELRTPGHPFPFANWIFDPDSFHEQPLYDRGGEEAMLMGTIREPLRNVIGLVWVVSDLTGQILGPYAQPNSCPLEHPPKRMAALKSLMKARLTILAYLTGGMVSSMCMERINSKEVFMVAYGMDEWFSEIWSMFKAGYDHLNS